MAMIDTADIVAERYKVSREYQDEYSLESQQRMAAAQQANKFKDEIVPMKTKMKKVDKETKAESIVDYVVDTRRVQPSRHDARRPRQARAGQGPGQIHHRRQRQPALRRRRRGRADGSQGSREARPQADGPLPRLGRRRLRAGRDGHRPGLRRAAPVEAPRPQGRRHRPLGAERSLRLPVPLLPRQARHRSREVQRQRRLDRDRPSLRHDRRASAPATSCRKAAAARPSGASSRCASAAARAPPACSRSTAEISGAFTRNIDRNKENGSARSHFPLGADKTTKIQTTKSPVLIGSEQGFNAVQT